MSRTIRKKEVTCDCGCDYGACGKTNVWVIEYDATVDTVSLYYKHHKESGNVFERLFCVEDATFEALMTLLNCDVDDFENCALITDEWEEFQKARGY